MVGGSIYENQIETFSGVKKRGLTEEIAAIGVTPCGFEIL